MSRDLNSAVWVLGCGLIGIIFAAIEQVLYDAGVIFDEFATGTITIAEVMAVTIIIWTIAGVIIALVRA